MKWRITVVLNESTPPLKYEVRTVPYSSFIAVGMYSFIYIHTLTYFFSSIRLGSYLDSVPTKLVSGIRYTNTA